VPRSLKLFEGDELHMKKPLLGVAEERLVIFEVACSGNVECKEEYLLMFEQDGLHRKKTFLGIVLAIGMKQKDVLVR
jgi:hypothetical protein